MSLKVIYCNEMDPFSKDFLHCPYCGGMQFTSINHAMVVCDRCDCRFTVEPAVGDGCVVNAFPPETGLYADRWRCPSCGRKIVAMPRPGPEPTCTDPECANYGLPLIKETAFADSKALNLPDRYICILRETECSGWIHLRESDGYPVREENPAAGRRTVEVAEGSRKDGPVRVVRA